MKWYLFSIGLFSFIIYRSTKSEINLRGKIKGVYDMDQKAAEVKIFFGHDNNYETYRSYINTSRKATSSYLILNNSKITISLKWSVTGDNAFSTNGKQNPKKDFVSGNWVNRDNQYGAFFQTKSLFK